MNKSIIFSLLAVLIFFACEEKNDIASNQEEEIVYGREGDLEDYFYGFYTNNDISSKYLHFSDRLQCAGTSDIDPTEDTLNLSSFSNYLLTVSADEYLLNTARAPFSEIASENVDLEEDFDINNDGEYHSSVIEDLTFSDSVPWNVPYNLIEKMEWDDSADKYKPIYGNTAKKYDTLNYMQVSPFDSLIFLTVIDSNNTSLSEFFFIDGNEYHSSIEMIETGEDTTIHGSIVYPKRNVPENSLLRLKNIDCNEDGKKSLAEVRVMNSEDCDNTSIFIADTTGGYTGYCDRVNGKFDAKEIHLDLGIEDDVYDSNEPFQDRNCNNTRDIGESIVSSDICGGNSIFSETHDEDGGVFSFCDTGNGIWDDAEWPEGLELVVFLDINDADVTLSADAILWDENEPFFQITGPLTNLIVDYQNVDQPDPIALEDVKYAVSDPDSDDLVPNSVVIKVGDSLSETGWSYYEIDNIIFEYEATATHYKTYSIIDHYETTYSNIIIEQLDEELTPYCNGCDECVTESECESANAQWVVPGMDYYILKSRWTNDEGYDYNYHAFRKKSNGDIALLTHPIYFTWPGYTGADFWSVDAVQEELFLQSNMGLLLEGDSLHVDSVFVTSTGDYLVTTEYVVETDTIAVPYTLGELLGNQVVCHQNGAEVEDFQDCPQDSSGIFISDCFKIKRTRIVKLFGNGVEFGLQNIIWLANLSSDYKGIVKSSASYRWSEPFWETNDDGSYNYNWIEYERWELMDYHIINQNSAARWNTSNMTIEFDTFQNHENFDYDVYKNIPLYGLHRQYLPGLFE